ncbi:ribonucleoside triphosphate reductase [Candidatus Woesearchaeota archaeon]|nr:ribonucleoside triphosphate reductase [Candidatus Woesearchaeota archaeon]
MKCPYCNENNTKVIDKRESEATGSNRRRRECLSCHKRFTTYEKIEEVRLTVLKRDGSKQDFDRAKLKAGILTACEKRPITEEQVDQTVNEIESELYKHDTTEISSKRIGDLVIAKLKGLDDVAYLRFTSVYKKFSDPSQFEKELKKLERAKVKQPRQSHIAKIKKRDGTIVDFDPGKITNAIFAAAKAVGGEDRDMAVHITNIIVGNLEERFDTKHVPSVEDIQDQVEKTLIEEEHAKTAKAFILYRQEHKKLRETNDMVIDVESTISEYLNQTSWRTKENSNTDYSFSGLMLHAAGKMIAHYALNEVYTSEIAEAHNKGYVHIHDLSGGFIGYCAGWSLKNLLTMGFGNVPNKVDAKPAKHLSVAVQHMVNFIGCLQMEFAGAQAFSSVDTLLAPFVKNESLTYTQVKQEMQTLIFSLNIPSRWGSQYPFSNLTFDWVVPEDMRDEKAIVGGVPQDFTYADCQAEMDMINKAFIEVMLKGDANGRIFTFPIPTYNVTKDFNWDTENAKLLFELTAKYGTPYFQNYVGSDLDPKSIRAMCCRLNLNTNELMNRPGCMWGPGDSTGSLGVVTLNVNRLGYEAETKEDFYKRLDYYMDRAKQSLEIKRLIVERNLKNGLMPYTKTYLGTFKNHFSTIGLCGMNEACLNFLGKDIASKEGKQFAIDTLNHMRERIRKYQQETGNLYNLEASPAESASYRFARKDKEMYPDIITAGDEEPFLTNSTYLPVDYTEDAILALEHQNDIQPLYTGGTMFHTFLGEAVSSGEAAKLMVKRIAHNTRLPYFSLTPTFSVCRTHGYLKGERPTCPECGKETEVYSRVVGYYRPVQNWNAGKREEYKHRAEYLEKRMHEAKFSCEADSHVQKGAKAVQHA